VKKLKVTRNIRCVENMVEDIYFLVKLIFNLN